MLSALADIWCHCTYSAKTTTEVIKIIPLVLYLRVQVQRLMDLFTSEAASVWDCNLIGLKIRNVVHSYDTTETAVILKWLIYIQFQTRLKGPAYSTRSRTVNLWSRGCGTFIFTHTFRSPWNTQHTELVGKPSICSIAHHAGFFLPECPLCLCSSHKIYHEKSSTLFRLLKTQCLHSLHQGVFGRLTFLVCIAQSYRWVSGSFST